TTVDNSVWFSFIAPPSGTVRIITDEFDSQLAMWSATDCSDFGTFVEIAANDDGGPGLSAQLEPINCLEPGALYYVQVDGFAGSTAANATILLEAVLGEDCNLNGLNDICDLDPTDPDGDGFVSADVNFNTVPDECEGNICPATSEIVVSIQFDSFAGETGYVIRDINSGINIANLPASSFDGQSNTFVENTYPVAPNVCFEFEITDSFGDGLCCGFGTGFYEVTFDGTLVASGGSFGASETSLPFGGCDFVDCNENCIDDATEMFADFDVNTLDPVAGDTSDDAGWICPDMLVMSDNLTTVDDDLLWCGVYFGGHDVWFKYRPAADGNANINITDAGPTEWVIVVYDADAGDEELVACNSDGASYHSFPVDSGTTYLIGIAARNYDRAPFNVMLDGPPCLEAPADRNGNGEVDDCECLADVNGDMVVNGTDFLIVLNAFGPCAGCMADVDGNGIVDNDDLAEIIYGWGDCDPMMIMLQPTPNARSKRLSP
ncbi:MAG: hypothetical protein KC983_05985, partial [Phycisphaerales bacterium]|nr:hypothetical protein [Phycisphaerales bacterium]